MPPTLVNVAGLDGGGRPITLRADQNVDNSLSLHTAPEVAGAAVSNANPLPTATPAAATVGSTALENSHILKAAPGTLYTLQMNATATGYLMLFDAATAPGDGAVTPRKVFYFTTLDNKTVDKVFNPPLAMTVGAVVAFSTTGPFTKTTPGSPSAQFSAEIA